jgi:methylated-DNA-[protein]-cysteine S-methyltransferase
MVPCHRVLGSNGSLTGYAGGLERKMDLLRREGVLSDPIDLLPLN